MEQKIAEKPSVYKRLKPSDRSKGISNYILFSLDSRLRTLNVGNNINTELSHEEVIKVLYKINNQPYINYLEEMAAYECNYDGEEDFINKLNFSKKSSGTATVERYNLIIKYEIDTDGIVKLGQITDLTNYKFSGEGIDCIADNLNGTERCRAFYTAFSKTYRYMPRDMILHIDLKRIADNSNILNLNDVIIEFRHLVKVGYFTILDARTNTGFSNYLQCIKISSYKEVPILNYCGNTVFTISGVKGLLNDVKSQEELENNMSIFRYPETDYNFITDEEGDCGIIVNGEQLCFKKDTESLLGNKYNIISKKDLIRYTRFYDDYKRKKAMNNEYKDPARDIKKSEKWENSVIKEGIELTNETDLYEKLEEIANEKTKAVYTEGGAFRDIDPNTNLYIYDDDTNWTEISSENYRNESELAKNKRLYTFENMKNRIETTFKIKGMNISKESSKYAYSVVNNANNIYDGRLKSMSLEEFNKLSIPEIKTLDTVTSIVKSRNVCNNAKIREDNNRLIAKVEKHFKHIYIKEMYDKEAYLNNYAKRSIREISKLKDLAEEDRETLLKIDKIDDIKEKLYAIGDLVLKLVGLDMKDNITNYINSYETKKAETEEIINEIINYKHINTLNCRTKQKLMNLIEEVNKITGKTLKIQNLKVQTINLIDIVIDENNNIINNEVDKEARKLVRKANTSIRKVKKVIKRRLYLETSYKDYETAKTMINFEEVCKQAVIDINNMINNEIIKNKYDTSNHTKLLDNLQLMLDREYEIEDGEDYFKDYGTLHNIYCKVA